MTDRIRLDDLTSDQYDELCADLDRLRAERTRYQQSLQQKTTQAHEQQAAIDRVRATASEGPPHDSNDAEWDCGWNTAMDAVQKALDEPGPAATPPLAEQLRAAIESAVYEYRELTCQWPETDGTTEEITRRATAAAIRALEEPVPITGTDGHVICTCTLGTRCGCGTSVHYEPGPAAPRTEPFADRPFRSHRQPATDQTKEP